MAVIAEWNDLNETARVFPYEWIEQCAIREGQAEEDSPAPDYAADHAHLRLWVGVWKWDAVPNEWAVNIGRVQLTCKTDTMDMGAEDEGEPAADVFVIVPCRDVRSIFKRPRGRR